MCVRGRGRGWTPPEETQPRRCPGLDTLSSRWAGRPSRSIDMRRVSWARGRAGEGCASQTSQTESPGQTQWRDTCRPARAPSCRRGHRGVGLRTAALRAAQSPGLRPCVRVWPPQARQARLPSVHLNVSLSPGARPASLPTAPVFKVGGAPVDTTPRRDQKRQEGESGRPPVLPRTEAVCSRASCSAVWVWAQARVPATRRAWGRHLLGACVLYQRLREHKRNRPPSRPDELIRLSI